MAEWIEELSFFLTSTDTVFYEIFGPYMLQLVRSMRHTKSDVRV